MLKYFGIDIVKFLKSVFYIPKYFKDYFKIKSQAKKGDFSFGKLYPILSEFTSEAGVMSGHYFHQDLYVAKRIFKEQPKRHVDIGSRIDGFVAHLAVFREVEVFDIREQKSQVDNIRFTRADLMELPDELISYTDSASALHSLEHFGLGRYGDPIDYEGYRKAILNIHAMIRPAGRFYFSSPIGDQRIEFNAHRVFSCEFLKTLFDPLFQIDRFSYVDDTGAFHENLELETEDFRSNFGCQFGCGIFEMRKR